MSSQPTAKPRSNPPQPMQVAHPDRLKGRVAIVTGGASGIGRASAERLTAAGASVGSGAVREFLLAKGVDVMSTEFKVSTPVSVRKESDQGKMGNNVSSWVIPLPIEEADPKRQLEILHDLTEELKETNQAIGVQMMNQIQEWTPSTLLSLGAQAGAGPINSIVTNVPGPQIPLYFHGARLRTLYPAVPLMQGMGLGIALTSYAGTMGIGFKTDPDLIPDVGLFIARFQLSMQNFAKTAGVEIGPISDEVNELFADRNDHSLEGA